METIPPLGRWLTVINCDGRRTGHSQRDVTDLSVAARVADLEAVIERTGQDRGQPSSPRTRPSRTRSHVPLNRARRFNERTSAGRKPDADAKRLTPPTLEGHKHMPAE